MIFNISISKLVSLLIVFISGASVLNASPNQDYQKELEFQEIKRHVEIRREMDKEATPFLMSIPKPIVNFNLLNFESINLLTAGLKDESMTFMEKMAEYPFFDVLMMSFSVIFLGILSVYLLWRFNPLKERKPKE